jgi:hypothetical protein
MTPAPIDLESLLACGVVFRRTADPEAGWKLLEGLESPDPVVRILAQTLLVAGGSASMHVYNSPVFPVILCDLYG